MCVLWHTSLLCSSYMCIIPQTSFVIPGAEGYTVHSSSQWPQLTQAAVAAVLGINNSRYMYMYIHVQCTSFCIIYKYCASECKVNLHTCIHVCRRHEHVYVCMYMYTCMHAHTVYTSLAIHDIVHVHVHVHVYYVHVHCIYLYLQ